jgi:hypothetical protein
MDLPKSLLAGLCPPLNNVKEKKISVALLLLRNKGTNTPKMANSPYKSMTCRVPSARNIAEQAEQGTSF